MEPPVSPRQPQLAPSASGPMIGLSSATEVVLVRARDLAALPRTHCATADKGKCVDGSEHGAKCRFLSLYFNLTSEGINMGGECPLPCE